MHIMLLAVHSFDCIVSLCLLTVVLGHNNRVEASPRAAVVARVTGRQDYTLQTRILATARSWREAETGFMYVYIYKYIDGYALDR